MLDAAIREAARQGVAHIEFDTPGGLFTSDRRFDLINCRGVLQRLSPREGLPLIALLLERLGSGGVAVFHFPHRARTSALVELSRRLRRTVPLVNGVFNALRGRPFDDPFIPSYVYALDQVLAVVSEAFRARFGTAIPATHLVFEHQDGFDAAVAIVQAPLEAEIPVTDVAPEDRPVDVRQMIATTSIDALNRTAEEYFSRLPNWDHHLAKPFNPGDDTPTILMGVAEALRGLRLVPGLTVLEFGAGTGWLSRWLTQLGCRAILVDVSPTALTIARETYARLPIIGDRPKPVFLTFDGRRIDLPDGSIDRILSFHAFHHVPNPDQVLAEFGRLLRPGGIAGFVEPGPTHSRDSQSQFEMRAYRVVENDVDIHAIWRTAQTCGFSDIRIAVHHSPPFHLSLREFEGFLSSGEAAARWVHATRGFLRHVRTFFLQRAGVERVDSRTMKAVACRITARLAEPATAGAPILIDVSATNTGDAVWLEPGAEYGGVFVGAHVYDAAGELLRFDCVRAHLTEPSREIAPGQTVSCRLVAPPLASARYVIEIDCVSSRITWFAQVGSPPARVTVDVA
jgi:SAM-dependent methyltransferase